MASGFTAINLGTTANDGTGTPLRTGGSNINTMFQKLFGAAGIEVPVGSFILPSHLAGNGAATLSTLTNSFAVYMPFLILETVSVDQAGIYVTTLQATGKVTGAIYNTNANNKPGTMIQNMGEILCSATGFRTSTALGTPKVLDPGLYWGCWHVFGINPQIATQRINNVVPRFIGGDAAAALAANTPGPRYYIETGITYGTFNTDPTVAAGITNDGAVMALRRAA